jgi:hypothetical protein
VVHGSAYGARMEGPLAVAADGRCRGFRPSSHTASPSPCAPPRRVRDGTHPRISPTMHASTAPPMEGAADPGTPARPDLAVSAHGSRPLARSRHALVVEAPARPDAHEYCPSSRGLRPPPPPRQVPQRPASVRRPYHTAISARRFKAGAPRSQISSALGIRRESPTAAALHLPPSIHGIARLRPYAATSLLILSLAPIPHESHLRDALSPLPLSDFGISRIRPLARAFCDAPASHADAGANGTPNPQVLTPDHSASCCRVGFRHPVPNCDCSMRSYGSSACPATHSFSINV